VPASLIPRRWFAVVASPIETSRGMHRLARAPERGSLGGEVREVGLSFSSKPGSGIVFLMISVVDLFRQAAELSDDDRATLAGLLIESLETEPDPDVEEAWARDIERRLAELDAGKVKTVPWETVRDRLLRRLGRP
jgi:putative addiction module component (TIGR02574 family)